MILFAVVLGVGVLLMSQKAKGSELPIDATPGQDLYPVSNKWNLPDIDSKFQGGGYNTQFDSVFEKVSGQIGIPFALLKAHAVAESSLRPNVSRDEGKGRTSYGLMQILHWPGSNRFAQFGYPDDVLGSGYAKLYDPYINIFIAGKIIEDNLRRFKGNLGDAINAYNTGVARSKRVAPFNYVGKVQTYYSEIVKREVIV